MSLMALLPTIGKVLDKVLPDKNARAAAQEALNASAQAGDLDLLLGQLKINAIEAAHPSIFVSGWRPACGWICAIGLLYNVVLAPFLDIFITVPEVDPALLYPVLLGMLGLSGSRSFEKSKGIARSA